MAKAPPLALPGRAHLLPASHVWRSRIGEADPRGVSAAAQNAQAFEPHSLTLPHKGGGENERRSPVTMGEAGFAAAQRLRRARVETPELDARVLLCHAAGLSHEAYVANPRAPLMSDAAGRFAGYIERRLEGEPVSRILGSREFYGRTFRIDRSTLDPRPDTETLIEAALELVERRGLRDKPLDILDLGTGSGAILITLLAELPQASGVGTDISPGALKIARTNAESLGVAERARFVAADWLEGLGGAFDLVVSNPPYIASGAMAGLAAEVRLHDPVEALDGGEDGLSAYRAIAASAPRVLRAGGSLLVEIGPDQAEAVLALLYRVGFALNEDYSIWRDLAGRPRVVAGDA